MSNLPLAKINMDIENIIDAATHKANLEILQEVQAAITEMVEAKFNEGLLLSPNWDLADGERGGHLYLPFGFEPEDILPDAPEDELYYYQEEALNILKELVQDEYYFEDEHFRELIINLPTGSGKTRIFLELLAWWKEFNVVVIAAPTISLVRQIENNTKNFLGNTEFEYAVVCSDKNLVPEEIEDEEDEGIYEMMVNSGEATTNVSEIRNTLIKANKPLVIFATYRSLDKIVAATDNDIDLLIGDEGHRMCDAPTNKLFDGDFPFKYKVYFTATVREKISNTEELLEYPMTSVECFGPVAYKKTPQELIDGGFILQPKMIATTWNTEFAEDILEEISAGLTDASDDVKHEFCLFVAGLIHLYNETGKIKNIAFVQSLDVADWYQQNFSVIVDIVSNIVGHPVNINPYVISQHVQGFDRVKMLRSFDNDDNAILFNYQVIKEGIDVQNCNSITWMRKMDAVGLMQSMGRSMRVDHNDPNKKYGYVICPINTDSKRKGDSIERMKDIAALLVSQGFEDQIIDEYNNSNREVGDGTKGRRYDRAGISFGKMTFSKFIDHLENVVITEDGKPIKIADVASELFNF